jgi:tRNA-dihydrouridine synthase B
MQNIRTPIAVRGMIIDPPLLLAPMAGLTHTALRQIQIAFGGVGLLSTEMLSARKLPTENPRISPYLIRTESERLLSYQLLISSVGEVGPALEALHRFRADAIDLNMGCTAPAVARLGAGIRLMEEPERVRQLVGEARKRTGLPLTAKIRLGFDERDRLRDFCRMLQDEGIDMLSIHARRRHESFARVPRWEHIATIRDCVSIPVVANGGIFSVDDARECLRVSGADGLMLGRGAAVRPWLFAEIAREVFGADTPKPEVSLPDIYRTFIEHLGLLRSPYRLGRLKEFTHYFARNYQFGHHLASRVQSSNSVDEAQEHAETFFAAAT